MIQATFELNGKRVSLTQAVTDVEVQFENDLLNCKRLVSYCDQNAFDLTLNLFQSVRWLKTQVQPYLLIQVTDIQTQKPESQIALNLYHPKKIAWYSHAVAASHSCSFVSTDAQAWLYQNVAGILKNFTKVAKLRLQPYMTELRDLNDYETIARRNGYKLVEPYGVIRTLFYNIEKPVEELMADLDKKTRAKVRHASREKVSIVRLNDKKWIPQMQAALNASFQRTGGKSTTFDFESYFNFAKSYSNDCLILGLFLNSRPEQLMAYSIDVRHGAMVEAISSGSLPDPELRKLHFNYFLLWDKVIWANDGQSKWLDLGGVTDASTSDPLAGISSFKRHFTTDEFLVGRETEFLVRPRRHKTFEQLVYTKNSLTKINSKILRN